MTFICFIFQIAKPPEVSKKPPPRPTPVVPPQTTVPTTSTTLEHQGSSAPTNPPHLITSSSNQLPPPSAPKSNAPSEASVGSSSSFAPEKIQSSVPFSTGPSVEITPKKDSTPSVDTKTPFVYYFIRLINCEIFLFFLFFRHQKFLAQLEIRQKF